MRNLPRKIRYKIVVPFTLLMVAATAVTAIISVTLISSYLEARFMEQIAEASAMVAQTDFALNEAVLANFKQILDADIVSYTREGQVLASTLSGEEGELLSLVQEPGPTALPAAGAVSPLLREFVFDGEPYEVAYRPLRTRDDAVVAFIVPTSAGEQAQWVVARNIAGVTLVLVIVLSIIGHFVARSITLPIHQLVEHTRRLTAGRLDEKAKVASRDEIAELATAVNEMTDQLRASEEKLLHSEKLALTGQLAARVAHDIRNPLSSIKMQAQMLRDRLQPGAKNEEMLHTILRDIERVEWVVQGFLDLGRPGSLDLDPGDINAVVDEALELSRAQLKHRKIAVKKSYGQGLPPVLMDGDRLMQAFLNVIVNAAEAMPNYGGTLLAKTACDPEGSIVRVAISDEGVGIAADLGEQVFDPFFTTKRDGVGLGLVNTKSIVERHGGTVGLVARDGGGTTALITLPGATSESLSATGGETHGARSGG